MYSSIDHINIALNMINYGGSFVAALGICLTKADTFNKKKLADAFPEYFKTYHEWKKQ